MQIRIKLCTEPEKNVPLPHKTIHRIMADNYLEKQYEQYEARKAAWEKLKKYGKKKKTSVLQKQNNTIQETKTKEQNL